MAHRVSKDDHGTAALNMHPTKCVCGSKQQTLFFTHRGGAFQFTYKEQAPSHQSVFLVVHLLGRKRHMGLV